MQKSLEIISQSLSKASNSDSKEEAIEHVESAQSELEEAKHLEETRSQTDTELRNEMTKLHEKAEHEHEILSKAEEDVRKKYQQQMRKNAEATKLPAPNNGESEEKDENPDESAEGMLETANCYLRLGLNFDFFDVSPAATSARKTAQRQWMEIVWSCQQARSRRHDVPESRIGPVPGFCCLRTLLPGLPQKEPFEVRTIQDSDLGF